MSDDHGRCGRAADRRPLRITQVVPTLDVAYGGPSRNAFELCKAFNARPAERRSTLLVMRRSRGVSVVDDHADRVRQDDAVRLCTARHALFQLRRSDVVVIHGVYFWWVIPMAVICRMLRVRVVVSPHGSLGARQRQYSTRKKRLFYALGGMWALVGARHVVVSSEAERTDVQEAFPLLRVRLGGVGVPVSESIPTTRAMSDPVKLLSVCRIHPKKRLDVGIRALAQLRRSGLECHYRIAGTGSPSLRGDLLALARREKVEDVVEFVGQQVGDAKRELFESSDVFLVPSTEENFGLGLAEALSHGLPAVATAAVAAAAVMDRGAGRVIADPNPAQLADAIRELTVEPDYGSLRCRAQELARTHFAWASVADHWMTLLRTGPDLP